jgi:formamidopyrimidine-DNA glycosylase
MAAFYHGATRGWVFNKVLGLRTACAHDKILCMPELPDIVVYLEALGPRILGQRLERVRLASPFLLRTVTPPIHDLEGEIVRSLRRLGKRIAIGLENHHWLVLHLMIAGRLHWREPVTAPFRPGFDRSEGAARDSPTCGLVPTPQARTVLPRGTLAAFDFAPGSVVLTEAGSRKRASLHVVVGAEGLQALDPGGLETLDASVDAFAARLTSENHTLKRALTDPRLFSGIGNAYSDEILHAARFSPAALTQRLSGEDIARLYEATRQTLREWTETLRRQTRGGFPEKVTAFREGMAVHGRYGRPCPRCGAKVQRIRYADNETNYCAPCQTGGKLLTDRALSRLLKQDWPRTLEEFEALKRR